MHRYAKFDSYAKFDIDQVNRLAAIYSVKYGMGPNLG